jgi:hypothetical protein
MENIYLAAHYGRAEEMRGVRDVLEASGYRVTSRWIDQTEQKVALGEQELNDRPELGIPFAEKDIADLRRSDTMLQFTGAGRGGRHVELGIAIILRLDIILVGQREHVFHTLPFIRHYRDWTQFVIAEIRQNQWTRT